MPQDKISRILSSLNSTLNKEGVTAEVIDKKATPKDPWDDLDIDSIAVDTGIQDFAKNHDHYLYGLPKRS